MPTAPRRPLPVRAARALRPPQCEAATDFGGPAPTAAQLADTFTEADVGADGSIDFSEFALYVRAHVDADLALVVATHTFSAEPDGH